MPTRIFPRSKHTEIHSVSLRRLFPQASFVGCADVRIKHATQNSKACKNGSLFAVWNGSQSNGADFISEAITNGATTLLVDRPIPDCNVCQCIVKDVRKAYAILCQELAGHPSCNLTLAAVTGTNGKTTVTWLIRSILHAAQKQTGLLGTIEYNDGHQSKSSLLTTPGSEQLAQWFRQMRQQEMSHAVFELSSHALDQQRAAGVELQVGVITNITQDHFDYHETYNQYLNCKARIAELISDSGCLVLNADDSGCRRIIEQQTTGKTIRTFSTQGDADFVARNVQLSIAGSTFDIQVTSKQGNKKNMDSISTQLVGLHNVQNCLAAVAACRKLGVSWSAIREGISSLTGVPGRLEWIDQGQPFHVFVDYAHTDDALKRCLASLKAITQGRLFCVFGAGGDRDCSKRPLLGRAACAADWVVVTSDNPRSEEPKQIIEDILSGMDYEDAKVHTEPDRRRAIEWALHRALPDDTIVIAGKGHEPYMLVGQDAIPFDDREIVREILAEMSFTHPEPEVPQYPLSA